MSWETIVKKDYTNAIKNLEKKVYSRFQGDSAMRIAQRNPSHEVVKLFVGVSKRLDSIAENPSLSTKDQLVVFMTQFLSDEFKSAESAELWLSKQK